MSSPPNTVQSLLYAQAVNYTDVLVACLNTYMWILDIDREKELIWSRKHSRLSKSFYAILRYGGLFANFAYIPGDNKNFSTPCTAILIMTQLMIYPVIYFVLGAMMGMRICALYGRSMRVIVITSTLFSISQAGNIILTILAFIPLDISVWYTPDVGSLCGYDISIAQGWYQASAKICITTYEFALFIMSLICLVRNSRQQRQDFKGTMSTLWGLIVRDNVMYFFIAFFSLLFNIISSLSSNIDESPLFTMVFSGIVENIFSQFQATMLGPLMMLSVLEYDNRRQRGGTSYETELETLEFAALSRYSHN